MERRVGEPFEDLLDLGYHQCGSTVQRLTGAFVMERPYFYAYLG